MKIIILGAGQVGGSLAETLIAENHDITLVDLDEHRLQYFADRLDIHTLRGHCSYPGVLRQAGADNADMLVAVTDNDEANIVACQVAYTLFNVPVKMARIRSRHYFVRKELFALDHIPIDVIVSPEIIVTRLITELLVFIGALRVLDFAEGKVKIFTIRPYYGGALIGKTLAQVYEYLSPLTFQIAAIYRDHIPIDLSEDTEIEVGDTIMIASETDYVNKIIAAFRREEAPLRNIMIVGGGNIGGSLARVLQDDYEVKLIDHNRGTCDRLSNSLRNVTVLCGDGNDSALLRDENIENIDAFLALTNDDEANIIAAIQAKQMGVRQTFSLINRTDYFDIIESSAINVRLSPPLATLGSILTHVRRGDIKAVYSVNRGLGEVIEAVIHGDRKTSKLVSRCIDNIKLPKEVEVVGVIRDEQYLRPRPDLVICADDHVIFYVKDKRKVSDFENLLQVSSGFF
jgi:trk system potassium uptake protein TrkA